MQHLVLHNERHGVGLVLGKERHGVGFVLGNVLQVCPEAQQEGFTGKERITISINISMIEPH